MQHFMLHIIAFNQACINQLNKLIEILSEWLTFNRLTPNIIKTKLMLVITRIVSDFPTVLFNEVELEWVDPFNIWEP